MLDCSRPPSSEWPSRSRNHRSPGTAASRGDPSQASARCPRRSPGAARTRRGRSRSVPNRADCAGWTGRGARPDRARVDRRQVECDGHAALPAVADGQQRVGASLVFVLRRRRKLSFASVISQSSIGWEPCRADTRLVDPAERREAVARRGIAAARNVPGGRWRIPAMSSSDRSRSVVVPGS